MGGTRRHGWLKACVWTAVLQAALMGMGLPCVVLGAAAPDWYEVDNSFGQANIFWVNSGLSAVKPQHHNFHKATDQDWVVFYGIKDEWYEISTSNAGAECDVVIEIYDGTGKKRLLKVDDTPAGEDELISWKAPKSDVYYLRLRQFEPCTQCKDTGYDLDVYVPVIRQTGLILGMVKDAGTNKPIEGQTVSIHIESPGKPGITFHGGSKGLYAMRYPCGTYRLTASAKGYKTKTLNNVVIVELGHVRKDLLLTPLTADAPVDSR